MSDLDGDLRLNRTLSRLSNIFPFETSHFHRNINEIEHVNQVFFHLLRLDLGFFYCPFPGYHIIRIYYRISSYELYQNSFLVRGPRTGDIGTAYEADLNIGLV